MIKAIEFPDREFATKQDLYDALYENHKAIIQLKQDQIYKSVDKAQFTFLNATKAMKAVESKGFEAKDNHIYPIISTTRYRDSHKDVHFDGCFAKTVKEQKGRIKYILDHDLRFDSVIAWPKDVNMIVADIDWSLVGKSYSGKTQALVFEINKDNIIRKDVLEAIEKESDDFENSIRMLYYKIRFGVDSKRKEHAEAKKYYDSRINEIANKEVVEEDGYFWGVEELGIYKEGSLVTAGGSNDATSIFHNKNIEAAASTSKTEPPKDTHKLFTHYF